MMRSRRGRICVAVAGALTAALLSAPTNPAAAAVDGPPVIDAVNQQAGPTAGGTPVRIYGAGLDGATSVKFGAVEATMFSIIDSYLITAVTPAAAGGTAANNTFVDVTVTDSEGTNTFVEAFFYTNATLTVTPNASLSGGSAITVALSGYKPSTGMVLPEVNPLLLYVERFPEFQAGPPPYAQVLTMPSTDASGNYTSPTGRTSLKLASPFVGSNNTNPVYDPNIACPVNQTTVNYLGTSAPATNKPAFSGKCLIAMGQTGRGTLETPFSFTADPLPAAPVLNLDKTSANQGEVVSIAAGSTNWNANPFFGSSRYPASKPGHTATEVAICNIGGNPATCSAGVGTGSVALTRYVDGDQNASGVQGVFSGATLSGSITVGPDVPDGCSCFVRVRQYQPGGGYIEAMRSVTIT